MRVVPGWLFMVLTGLFSVTKAGWKEARIGAVMGAWGRCVRTWIGRWAAGGEDGLKRGSWRPYAGAHHDQGGRRAERSCTPGRAGAPALTCSPSREGARHRRCRRSWPARAVACLPDLDPVAGEVIGSCKQTAVRYEGARPGGWCTWKVKKVGKIPGGGWGAQGL